MAGQILPASRLQPPRQRSPSPSPAPASPTAAAPLTPNHKSEARRAYREVRTAIALLQQRWPAAFPQTPQQVRPLITGLTSLIAVALGWGHPYTRAVLRTWKLRPAYCHAVLAHPVRYDLEGRPTDQPVNEDARTQAKARLAAWASKRRPEPRPGEPAVTPAAAPDPQQQEATAGCDLPPPPQQQSSPPASKPTHPRVQTTPTWRSGDRVRWNAYVGTILRETVGGDVEVLIGPRTYKVPKAELRPA